MLQLLPISPLWMSLFRKAKIPRSFCHHLLNWRYIWPWYGHPRLWYLYSFKPKTGYYLVAHLFYTSVHLGFGKYLLVYAFCYTSQGQWSPLALFFARGLVMPRSSSLHSKLLASHVSGKVIQRFEKTECEVIILYGFWFAFSLCI